MNALAWVQMLTLGAVLAVLGWAWIAGPLGIVSRSAKHFLVFNVLFALGALCWVPWPVLDELPVSYRLTVGLMGVVSGMQWLCVGLHRLYDLRPSYVVSPVMLPVLAGILAVVAWFDLSGRFGMLASFSACVWMLGVTVHQGFAAMSAHVGVRTARWALAPLIAAAAVWLTGMLHNLVGYFFGGAATASGVAEKASGLPSLTEGIAWLVSWGLLNAGLIGFVLLKLLDKIRDLSTEDDLTGAMNLRTFMNLLNAERDRIQRSPQVQALLACELDQYDALNRQLGFAAGDAALRHLTGVMGRGLRKTDRLGSTQQGELLLFLPSTPIVGATLVAERMQAAVKASPLLWKGQSVQLSVSMGLTARADGLQPSEAWVDQAMTAMQRAHKDGGNRVRVAVDTRVSEEPCVPDIPLEDDDTGPLPQSP